MKKRNQKHGWVYFIKNGEYHKVGLTKSSISSRMSCYRTHNPYKISLVRLIYVDDCKKIESQLHTKYFSKEKSETDWKTIEQDAINSILLDMSNYQTTHNFIPNWVDVI